MGPIIPMDTALTLVTENEKEQKKRRKKVKDTAKRVMINGKEYLVDELAKEIGITLPSLYARIRKWEAGEITTAQLMGPPLTKSQAGRIGIRKARKNGYITLPV